MAAEVHEDLVSAERLATGPPLVSVVSFHSQQAAEKALKGYLAWHDQPFRKTHRLGELVDQCVATDFPFISRLPSRAEQRRQQVAFVRNDVLSHTNLGPGFRARVARLEPAYDLAAWAQARTGQPGGLPVLAQTRWRRFIDHFNATSVTGWQAARDVLRDDRDMIEAAAAASWVSSDEDVHWRTVSDLLALSDAAETAEAEIEPIKTIADLVHGYVDRWWRVDWLHLHVRGQAARAGLSAVIQVADAAYFLYARAAADRMTALVEVSQMWPPGVCEASKAYAPRCGSTMPSVDKRCWSSMLVGGISR